jgi:hypothetical protein
MWRRALIFSCSLASLVASCQTNAPSVPAAPAADGGGEPAAPDVAGVDGADGAGAEGAIVCRTRDDCDCTMHYTPTRSRRPRFAEGGTRDETPRDCIIECRRGRCTATQAPM